MINIKKFVDKVASIDARSGRDVVLSVGEARMLRDEITKLLADRIDRLSNTSNHESADVIKVELTGGKW
jgi:hypothetical protein